MPQEQSRLQRQVSYAQRKSNQIGEESQAGMRQEKFPAHRKQFRMQDSLDSGQVDFSVFGAWMVAMHQKGPCCEQRQP